VRARAPANAEYAKSSPGGKGEGSAKCRDFDNFHQRARYRRRACALRESNFALPFGAPNRAARLINACARARAPPRDEARRDEEKTHNPLFYAPPVVRLARVCVRVHVRVHAPRSEYYSAEREHICAHTCLHMYTCMRRIHVYTHTQVQV